MLDSLGQHPVKEEEVVDALRVVEHPPLVFGVVEAELLLLVIPQRRPHLVLLGVGVETG